MQGCLTDTAARKAEPRADRDNSAASASSAAFSGSTSCTAGGTRPFFCACSSSSHEYEVALDAMLWIALDQTCRLHARPKPASSNCEHDPQPKRARADLAMVATTPRGECGRAPAVGSTLGRKLPHLSQNAEPTYLLTYYSAFDSIRHGRADKNLCRCFGAPARRVFPDHLITTSPRPAKYSRPSATRARPRRLS